jgi:uncharacterized protein (DUF2147 family)
MIKKLFLLVLFSVPMIAFSQNAYVGMWKNLDDEDGKEKSHIKVYEENGELKAQVIKLLPNAKLRVCEACKGNLKNKPIEGMFLMSGMKQQKDGTYSEGNILNPKNGKSYSCTISLEGKDKMKVRGYLGLSLIGKTQYWYRLKD